MELHHWVAVEVQKVLLVTQVLAALAGVEQEMHPLVVLGLLGKEALEALVVFTQVLVAAVLVLWAQTAVLLLVVLRLTAVMAVLALHLL